MVKIINSILFCGALLALNVENLIAGQTSLVQDYENLLDRNVSVFFIGDPSIGNYTLLLRNGTLYYDMEINPTIDCNPDELHRAFLLNMLKSNRGLITNETLPHLGSNPLKATVPYRDGFHTCSVKTNAPKIKFCLFKPRPSDEEPYPESLLLNRSKMDSICNGPRGTITVRNPPWWFFFDDEVFVDLNEYYREGCIDRDWPDNECVLGEIDIEVNKGSTIIFGTK